MEITQSGHPGEVRSFTEEEIKTQVAKSRRHIKKKQSKYKAEILASLKHYAPLAEQFTQCESSEEKKEQEKSKKTNTADGPYRKHLAQVKESFTFRTASKKEQDAWLERLHNLYYM